MTCRFPAFFLMLSVVFAALAECPIDKTSHQYLFVEGDVPFRSCHASTIAELDNGDLVVAYFGGSYEGCEDVCIWVSRKGQNAAEWSAPIMAADGVLSDTLRKACYNPVLQLMPNGELWLFFKIGSCVADWTGWLTKSLDGGKTWSAREALPEGFLGPIKNKPLLMGDKLLCPSSTEKDGWRIHFEILDLKTGQWHKVGPVKGAMALTTMDINKPDAQPQEIMCIQPALLQMADGALKALCRTKNGKLATTTSYDGGETWSEVVLTDLPSNNSGIDAVTLSDGRHMLVYNPKSVMPGEEFGSRRPLNIAVSDDSEHWDIIFNEDSPGELSYPAIIQGHNGHIYITYTFHRKRIVFWDLTLK